MEAGDTMLKYLSTSQTVLCTDHVFRKLDANYDSSHNLGRDFARRGPDHVVTSLHTVALSGSETMSALSGKHNILLCKFQARLAFLEPRLAVHETGFHVVDVHYGNSYPRPAIAQMPRIHPQNMARKSFRRNSS